MIWDCFENNQVNDIIKIEGTLKKEEYRDVLELIAVRKMINWIFRRALKNFFDVQLSTQAAEKKKIIMPKLCGKKSFIS